MTRPPEAETHGPDETRSYYGRVLGPPPDRLRPGIGTCTDKGVHGTQLVVRTRDRLPVSTVTEMVVSREVYFVRHGGVPSPPGRQEEGKSRVRVVRKPYL